MHMYRVGGLTIDLPILGYDVSAHAVRLERQAGFDMNQQRVSMCQLYALHVDSRLALSTEFEYPENNCRKKREGG